MVLHAQISGKVYVCMCVTMCVYAASQNQPEFELFRSNVRDYRWKMTGSALKIQKNVRKEQVYVNYTLPITSIRKL